MSTKAFVNTEHVALGAQSASEVRLKNTKRKKDIPERLMIKVLCQDAEPKMRNGLK